MYQNIKLKSTATQNTEDTITRKSLKHKITNGYDEIPFNLLK
jgi:hypothetical protein